MYSRGYDYVLSPDIIYVSQLGSIGMAIAPWNVLVSGKIRTDEEEQRRLATGEGGRAMFGDWRRSEEERKVCMALEKVAQAVGAQSITSGSSFVNTYRFTCR